VYHNILLNDDQMTDRLAIISDLQAAAAAAGSVSCYSIAHDCTLHSDWGIRVIGLW